MIVALPPLSIIGPEVKLPLVRIIDPVGVGRLDPPLTLAVTDSVSTAVTLGEDSVTVTGGTGM